MSTHIIANKPLLTRSGLEIKGFDILKPAISASGIESLLVSAFEGGSNYWYDGLHIDRYPTGFNAENIKVGGLLQPIGEYWHWSTLIPMTGGAISFLLNEGPPWKRGKEPKTCPPNYKASTVGKRIVHITIDRDAISRGLEVFATKQTHHYADFLSENADATTGDVFLQCCSFGEVIFG